MRRLLMLGLLLVSLCGCSNLLFFPQKGLPFTPAVAKVDYRDVALTATDGTRLHAWWMPAKAGVAVKGTVLHLHGNGGNVATHLGGSYWLPEQGYNVLLLDYRGYGNSEGKPNLPGVYQDIDAAFAWLHAAPETNGQPLYVLGQSIGGALAVRYLSEHPEQAKRLSALVLDGVPASYRDIAQLTLSNSWLTWPLQVPLSWLVPDGDSALAAIGNLPQLPLLIYQSIDDTVVPLSNGVSLYQAARPPRVFQPTRGGHVQTFADPVWRQVMLMFLSDPTGFTGLRRLAEVPNTPTSDSKAETAQ